MHKNLAAPERISSELMDWIVKKEYCSYHVWEYEEVGDNVDWFVIQVFKLQ